MQLFHKNGRFVFSSLFSNHGRFLQLFSTSTTATTEAPKLVDYLVKSLGFSNQQAISTSLKVRESNLNRNPYFVVDFFKQSGFDDAHIRKFVSKDPSVLKSDVDKTLKPRIRVLQDLGLSGSDLGDFIADCRPRIFRNISKNVVDLLTPIVGTNENVLKVLKRSHFTFSTDIATRNFTVLRKNGVSVERLQRLLVQHPEFLCYNPEKLEDICARVCDELGISVKSHTFIPMIRVLLVNRAENLDLKYEVFKSYGWTESDIGTLIRKQPDCLNLSQVMIRRKLEYFMKELGLEAAYIASRPCILGFSMEKRLVPRNAVLRLLKERKLVSAAHNLLSAFTISESRFLSRFVIPYNHELPGLVKAYSNNQMDSFSTSC